MKKKRENVFLHAGDIGDIIACLPTIRAMGGGNLVIGPGYCRESMFGARFDAIKPLLEAQSYIRSVEWMSEPIGITEDFSTFRKNHIKGESLAHWQARHLGVEISLEPWLDVGPIRRDPALVIFARSPRYHFPHFPWFKLIKQHKDAVFVGAPSEHVTFCEEFRCKIGYQPTGDLLELAKLIASAGAFYGNQSCPFWIAAGLGVNLTQEVWPHDANSIIPRPNASYPRTPEDCEEL